MAPISAAILNLTSAMKKMMHSKTNSIKIPWLLLHLLVAAATEYTCLC